MIVASATRRAYSDLKPHLDFIQSKVRETLATYADPRGWAVLVRIKALDSLSEKLELGRVKEWSAVDDLVAATLVVPTMLQEREALDFLQRAFEQTRLNPRGGTKKPPENFRFDNTRFVGRLSRPEDIPDSEPSYSTQFEVQIRTAFEHAWSVATHSLTYKGPEVSWERQRLTAQLKATVEQLDMLILAFDQTSKTILPSSWPETSSKGAIVSFFKNKFEGKSLPEELEPKDWTRFADCIYAISRQTVAGRSRDFNQRDNAVLQMLLNLEKLLPQEAAAMPRSVSLAQYIFGLLYENELLQTPLGDYTPVITSELEELFPTLRDLAQRFVF